MKHSTTIGDYTIPTAATGSSEKVQTSIITDDFSSDNFTHNDSGKTSVLGGTLNLQNLRDNTNDACVYDISALLETGALDGDFRIRFEIEGDVAWTNNGNSVFWFGIASGDETVDSDDVQDAIGMELRNNTGERAIGACWKDGVGGHLTDVNKVSTTFNWATSTRYYCTIERIGNDVTCSVTTNSDYVTGTTSATSSSITAVAGLKFIKFSNLILAGGATVEFDGLIDNLEIKDVDVTLSASRAIDNDTAKRAETNSENNPNYYFDMASSLFLCAIAIYPHANTTETEIKIQSSPDAAAWTDERKITVSKLTNGQWNYIRLNLVSARYLRAYGNSGTAKILSYSEVKILTKTEAEIDLNHGHLAIDETDTTIDLDGT
ncbi:MAG: hypothetical protein IIA83_12725 [Thaumarchaeota archaeon]|nr:hypothetical protein [Nitrososphaerota archaeon]